MRLALRLAIPGAIAALTFIACAANPTAASNAPATSAAATKSAAASQGTTVDIKGFAFAPATLTVAKGTVVTFTNSDAATHTVTSGTSGTKDGKFDERLEQGGATKITFDTPGTYQYFCAIHASMKGTITVQ